MLGIQGVECRDKVLSVGSNQIEATLRCKALVSYLDFWYSVTSYKLRAIKGDDRTGLRVCCSIDLLTQ